MAEEEEDPEEPPPAPAAPASPMSLLFCCHSNEATGASTDAHIEFKQVKNRAGKG